MKSLRQRILSLSLLCAALAGSQAHGAAMGLVTFGVKGGLGFYGQSISTIPVVSMSSGFIGGASVNIGVALVGLEADVLYTQRKLTLNSTTAETLNYLTIPVLADLSLGIIHAKGGVFYASGLSASGSVGGVASGSSFGDLGLSANDLGFTVGLGIRIPLMVAGVSVEARYNQGLRDISNNASATVKSRSFDILAGVDF